MTDRRAKILSGLNLAALTGAEIGSLDRPLVRRRDGAILYVDHVDTAALRRKYAADRSIDIANIVDVDAVWGNQTLRDAVGRTVDYVVASHVIEHVPDLITWLAEVRDVLVPGGELRLAVPDRRFTFDYRRAETRLSDVVHAWLFKARQPLPHSILDSCLEGAEIDPVEAWRGDVTSSRPMHTFQGALAVAADARDNGTYHDVHCWVFTPVSFVRLMRRLAAPGLVGFSCRSLDVTEAHGTEFIVHAERCDDPATAAASWQAILTTIEPPDRLVDAEVLRLKIASLSAELDSMRNSTTWRATRPLRSAVLGLKRALWKGRRMLSGARARSAM